MNAPVVFENVSFTYPESDRTVFTDVSLTLPEGVVSLIGQNGVGKSTLMLLAGGRLLPERGQVKLFGRATAGLTDEQERNRYASFVYQNMEFESEESIGELLEFVQANGVNTDKDPAFLKTLIETFELGPILSKRTQNVSKGELQRTIIAFSLLYGSPLVLMDEPIFALEEYQKERTMKFLTEYARTARVCIYYSVHELEISRKFSDFVLLFYKDGTIRLGPTEEVMTRENLENAYQIPYSMLHRKDNLYREMLMKTVGRNPSGE
jgi:iron complex transport system ATP-binding protein